MKLTDRVVIWIGYLIIWITGVTSRTVIRKSPEYVESEKNNQKFIYALWHGRQLVLIWTHRKRNIQLLISQSKDGEYIAKITEKLGFGTVRGSSSRGGAKALVGMIRKLREGFDIAVTPDGPRGPMKEVKSGIILVAQKTGCPIIPMGSAAKREYLVKNWWDEFHIPYMFNKFAVYHGKPVYVNKNDDIEKKALELKKAIDDATIVAESLI